MQWIPSTDSCEILKRLHIKMHFFKSIFHIPLYKHMQKMLWIVFIYMMTFSFNHHSIVVNVDRNTVFSFVYPSKMAKSCIFFISMFILNQEHVLLWRWNRTHDKTNTVRLLSDNMKKKVNFRFIENEQCALTNPLRIEACCRCKQLFSTDMDFVVQWEMWSKDWLMSNVQQHDVGWEGGY